jgi:hypothetical protein
MNVYSIVHNWRIVWERDFRQWDEVVKYVRDNMQAFIAGEAFVVRVTPTQWLRIDPTSIITALQAGDQVHQIAEPE